MKEVMRVVSGLAVDVNNPGILMGLRGPYPTMRPDLWELPGGKVDSNETPVEALCREWKEELGVTIQPNHVGPLLAVATLDVDRTYIIELYPILIDRDFAPKCIIHQKLQWVGPAYAMAYLPCSPGYYMHYPQIMDWYNRITKVTHP